MVSREIISRAIILLVITSLIEIKTERFANVSVQIGSNVENNNEMFPIKRTRKSATLFKMGVETPFSIFMKQLDLVITILRNRQQNDKVNFFSPGSKMAMPYDTIDKKTYLNNSPKVEPDLATSKNILQKLPKVSDSVKKSMLENSHLPQRVKRQLRPKSKLFLTLI